MGLFNRFSTTFIAILVTLLYVFSANFAKADIYKWRDKSGVTQYSDNLPAISYAKTLRVNTINILHDKHSKGFCDNTPISQLKNINHYANFFNITNSGIASANNGFGGANTGFANAKFANNKMQIPIIKFGIQQSRPFGLSMPNRNNPVVASGAVKPLINKSSANQYLPLSTNSFFNWGGKKITVFGQPIKTAQNTVTKPSAAPVPKTILAPSPAPNPSQLPVPAPNPAPISPAATGKVFYIALNGNNNNPGTEALPWRNLNHAVYAMRAGDTVLVKNGTYLEPIFINRSGSAGKPITYKAYPGHNPKIEVNFTPSEGILLLGVSYINVEGFEVA